MLEKPVAEQWFTTRKVQDVNWWHSESNKNLSLGVSPKGRERGTVNETSQSGG